MQKILELGSSFECLAEIWKANQTFPICARRLGSPSLVNLTVNISSRFGKLLPRLVESLGNEFLPHVLAEKLD